MRPITRDILTFCNGVHTIYVVDILGVDRMKQPNREVKPGGTAARRDPRERFVELATKRVTRAIKDLRLVANLSNRRVYSYTEADAKKIVRALQREVDALRARFQGDDGGDSSIFSLQGGN
jgi:hypothetical protein